MVDDEQERTAMPTTPERPSKEKGRRSDAMKRTSDWIFSQEIPSDVTISVGDVSFSLHKFALASKCGYIKKLLSNSKDSDLSVVEIPNVPGGPEGFTLAANFCYGTNIELSTENIAVVRCVAEFLEMTEDHAVENLLSRTEAYLNEVGLKTLPGSVSILQSSANLLPVSEKVKLIDRCVDNIVLMIIEESQVSLSPDRLNSSKAVVEWWAEDLIVLRVDIFQRVLLKMISRGFKQFALGPVLMLYAQKYLRGFEIFGKAKKRLDPKQEHEKRVVLETIVSLLPREKNAMSISFLSMLLRAAICLDTTLACRLDLEQRMGFQLGQAVLDDILIPSFHFDGDTLFDVDTVQRIMTNYLEHETMDHFDVEYVSPTQSDMEKVGKLMESYLSEIASDQNLVVSKFISIAELIPEQARVIEDGMYRAIDIYLKAHPVLSDMERKRVCSLMDCQKLSREACAHAAQNDRLPVQTVVQLLYYEQKRLRQTKNDTLITGSESPATPAATSAASELSRLRKENQDLKFELLQMKMKLKEAQKPSAADQPKVNSPMGTSLPPSANKPPLPRKSFMSSLSKTLGKITPFLRADGVLPSSSRGRNKAGKDRRHSVS